METLMDAVGPANADDHRNELHLVQVEVILEGASEPATLEVTEGEHLLAEVRERLGLGPDMLLFERDKDEPLSGTVTGRMAIRLVASRAKQVTVRVNYDHLTIEDHFPPSKTVFKVLQWAVGKKGFDLDPVVAAKANLILPGADTPLPREAAIGSFVEPGEKLLVVDLTLRDFTNG